jgi:prolyl 4-hydroxylase
MSGKRLDASWAGWLAENLRRGCNPEELLGLLLSNAFDIRSIKSAMGAHYPVHSPLALAAEGRDPDPIDVETIAHPRLVLPGSGAVRFDTELMQLYTIERFLDDATCDELCEVVDRNLRRSTVTLVSEPGYRSSRTSDLGLLDAPVVARVDLQIARMLGIRLAYSEVIQGQRYDVGEEFREHTDYFEPGTPEHREHAGARGNRTWTFMVYLNDVAAGGATRFLALDHDFVPVKGNAVVWNNLWPDGTVNPNTLHAGMPVTTGHKVIITKWFRERGTGPMAFDD